MTLLVYHNLGRGYNAKGFSWRATLSHAYLRSSLLMLCLFCTVLLSSLSSHGLGLPVWSLAVEKLFDK